MNARNTSEEVAEFAIEHGIVTLKKDEQLLDVSAPTDSGDLPIIVVGISGKRRNIVIQIESVRKALNVNAYWEEDAYNGGEKFLIVPMD